MKLKGFIDIQKFNFLYFSVFFAWIYLCIWRTHDHCWDNLDKDEEEEQSEVCGSIWYNPAPNDLILHTGGSHYLIDLFNTMILIWVDRICQFVHYSVNFSNFCAILRGVYFLKCFDF